MATKTTHEPLLKAVLKPEAVLPFATSLIVAGPCTFLSVMLMNKHVSLPDPWLWMIGILSLAGFCMVAALLLEPARERIGRLTMAGLLGFVAVVFMYVLAHTLNRYITELGYDWLFPFVLGAQGLCYCAVFCDKHLLLKALLALNGLALTVLWCLGAGDRIVLPF